VHIQVQPKLSVSEGHQISEMVRRQLIEDIEEVTDVMVHIDPEDDEFATPCCQLPDRGQIMTRLQKHWADIPEAKMIKNYNLHYLDGKIHVEAQLPLSVVNDQKQAAELVERLQRATRGDREIAEVAISFTA
jgi:divalent metal cation (Fe/Co/Zn/Cd) transporter